MPITIRNTSRKAPPEDYLKYWKVVKYWVKRKYKINTGDLELMLFLYSEHLFNKNSIYFLKYPYLLIFFVFILIIFF